VEEDRVWGGNCVKSKEVATREMIKQCWAREPIYSWSFSWVCPAIDLFEVCNNNIGPQGGNEVLMKSVDGTKLSNHSKM